jgi:CobQ-like glutamine amidotransferase family enzyme
LNGDAANAKVLLKRLHWAKVEAQLVNIESEADLDALVARVVQGDEKYAIFSGHGSNAAMKSLDPVSTKLKKLFALAEASNSLGLVVGSSLLFTSFSQQKSKLRRSEFALAEVVEAGWPTQALGYVNSDFSGELVKVSGQIVLTQLHGPFLAKNPKWADEILLRLGVSDLVTQNRAKADDIAAKIWKLETEN